MKSVRYIVFILTVSWAMHDLGFISHLIPDAAPYSIELTESLDIEVEEPLEDETEKHISVLIQLAEQTTTNIYFKALAYYSAPMLVTLDLPPEQAC